MKQRYDIRLANGDFLETRTYETRHMFITNRVRAELNKIENWSGYAKDTEALNALLNFILETPARIDFADALTVDTETVLTDFFSSFAPKTSE